MLQSPVKVLPEGNTPPTVHGDPSGPFSQTDSADLLYPEHLPDARHHLYQPAHSTLRTSSTLRTTRTTLTRQRLQNLRTNLFSRSNQKFTSRKRPTTHRKHNTTPHSKHPHAYLTQKHRTLIHTYTDTDNEQTGVWTNHTSPPRHHNDKLPKQQTNKLPFRRNRQSTAARQRPKTGSYDITGFFVITST